MHRANRDKPVSIEFTPTFDERRHGEHGYTRDAESSTDELRAFAAPALAGFKGESLQQARQTVDGEKSEVSKMLPPSPIDQVEFAEWRALEALAEQQDRESTARGGSLGASNAHLSPIRTHRQIPAKQ